MHTEHPNTLNLKTFLILLFSMLMLLFVQPQTVQAQEIFSSSESDQFIYGIPDSLKKKIGEAVPNIPVASQDKPARLLVFNLHLFRDEVRKGHPSIPYTNYAIKLMGEKTGAWET